MVKSDTDLLDSINVAVFPDGRQVVPRMLFGNGITYSGGAIVAAETMSQVR